MNRQDKEFAHESNGTPTTIARKTARHKRIPSYCEFATHRKGKKVEMAVEGPLIANHQDVVVEAALQGLGILYAYDDDHVGEALASGRLKRVLSRWSLTSPGLIDCLLDRDKAASK